MRCSVLLNKGEAETVVLETKFGFVKSVGDSEESEVDVGKGGLLSLNNNPLLLLRSYFAPSAVGTGSCRLGSFAAMMSMWVGSHGMGPPNI